MANRKYIHNIYQELTPSEKFLEEFKNTDILLNMGVPELKEINNRQKEIFKYINECKIRYESGEELALIEAIRSICSEMFQLTGHQSFWIERAATASIYSKLETEHNNFQTGIYCLSLVEHNCSVRQATLAISEWLGKSETHVREAYYQVKNYYLEKFSTISEDIINGSSADLLEANLNKPFPQKYPKALKAYEKIAKELKQKKA